YMLDATRHWRPILNGYSGFVPVSYVTHYQELRGFPDRRAIAALSRAGVTHVVVHFDALGRAAGPDAVGALHLCRDLPLIETDGSVGLYQVAAGSAARARR